MEKYILFFHNNKNMKSTFYINIQCGKHTNHAHCLISENKEESSEIIAPVLDKLVLIQCSLVHKTYSECILSFHWTWIDKDEIQNKFMNAMKNNYNYSIFYIFKGQSSKLIVVLIWTCCEISKVKVIHTVKSTPWKVR